MKKVYIRSYTLDRIKSICNLEIEAYTLYSSKYSSYVAIVEANKSLNTSNRAIISHNTEGEFFLKKVDDPYNESIKVKLGKIIQAITPTQLTPELIEHCISKWKSAYSVDTSIVKTSSDIAYVYNFSECGGSCMAHKGELMDIYTHFNCEVAYITDDFGDLVARAILWYDINYSKTNAFGSLATEASLWLDTVTPNEEIKKGNFIDRIFFEKEEYKLTLQKWAKENGYQTFKNNSDYIYYTDDRPLNQFDNGVPYLDTLFIVGYDDNSMCLASTTNIEAKWFDEFRNTNGASDNGDFGKDTGVYCEDIEDYLPEDEATYIEAGDYYVSNDYEYLAYIEEWGVYVDTDNGRDEVVFAEDEDRWIPAKDAYYVVDRDVYYKYNDELYYCVDSGEYYIEDYDLYYTEDTQEYYENNDNLYCCEDTDHYFANDDDIFYTTDTEEYYENDTNLYYILEVDEYYAKEENYNNRLEELKDV